MTLDIEKLKQAAEHFKLNDCPILVNPLALLELITRLEETKADLAHANSVLIKVEKLIEGVEYRGDYAEGVRVMKDSLEAAERDAAKWQAYQKRKQEVIAAGMGRKIMRDLEPYDALPAFYAAMKEKP